MPGQLPRPPRHERRLVALAAMRHGRQKRAVGFDEQPVVGHDRRRPPAGRSPSGTSRCRPARGRSPRSSARRAAPTSPVKQWNTPRTRRGPRSLEDRERVVVGLARVDHDGQTAARAPASSCSREHRAAARRAARSRSGSRGRSRRPRAIAGCAAERVAQRAGRPGRGWPAHSCAWCGCTPTAKRTPAQSAAHARGARRAPRRRRPRECTARRVRPASRARAMTASRSASNDLVRRGGSGSRSSDRPNRIE